MKSWSCSSANGKRNFHYVFNPYTPNYQSTFNNWFKTNNQRWNQYRHLWCEFESKQLNLMSAWNGEKANKIVLQTNCDISCAEAALLCLDA